MALSSKCKNYPLYAWRDNRIRLKATQGEGGIKIAQFTLLDDNGAINLSSAASVTFDGIKRNGQGCCINCEIVDAANGIIEFVEQTGITDIDGNVNGTINVVSAEGNIKFDGIILYVAPNNTTKLIEASQAFSAFVEALNKLALITPEGTIAIDDVLTDDGVNAVQGKVIKAAIDKKLDNSEGSVKRENIEINAVGSDEIDSGAVDTTHLSSKSVTAEKLSDEVVNEINKKSDKSDSLAGYGILDAYTKNDIDSLLNKLGTKNYSFLFDTVGRIFSFTWDNEIKEGSFGHQDDTQKGYYVWLGKDVTNVTSGALDNVENIKKIWCENSEENVSFATDYDNVVKSFGQNPLSEFYKLASIVRLHSEKADKSNSLSGYGIEDAYTKAEVDTALSGKIDDSDGAVKRENIENNAVGTDEIDSGAVETVNIADSAVTSDKIANKAVTSDKIVNGAITSTKIASGAVSGNNIAQNQINTVHIQSKAITKEKLSDDVVADIDSKATNEALDKINESLKSNYGCKLVFDEITKELSLHNSIDEVLGDSITIKAGIEGIDMSIEQDENENYWLVTTDVDGAEVARVQLPATGGGGSGSFVTMKLRNLLTSNTFSIPYDEKNGCTCEIKYNFSSVYNDGDSTGNGVAVYYVDGYQVLTTQSLVQGDTTIDLGSYLTPNKTNTVKVTVTDSEGNKKTLTYNITVSYNYITSEFPFMSVQETDFSIPVKPVGSGTMTIHCLVDGVEKSTITTTRSNQTQLIEVKGLSHGGHTIEIYMSTVLSGYTEAINSESLKFGVTYIESGNKTPILFAVCESTEITQYSYATVNYVVYGGDENKCSVTASVDGDESNTFNVTSASTNVWTYRIMTEGEHTLSLSYGDLTTDIKINATPIEIVEAETSNLQFLFNPTNRSNNEPVEQRKKYSYTNSSGTTYDVSFNGIDFVEDGWTGNSLKIPLGGTMTIPYQPFYTDVNTTLGKTIEFNFKTKNVYDYSSNVISCIADNKGIQITPNDGTLFIDNNNKVNVQYNDETDIRLSFVITPRNSANNYRNQLIYVYVNSNIAGIIKYSSSDNFNQSESVGITLGSEFAEIEVYNIRCYNVSLDSYQVLHNYIADTPDVNEMIARNNRNNIFDSNNDIDFNLLPDECPYLIIECPELPQYKGDKKSGVSGRFVDKLNPDKSFTFTGAEFDVQGTTSAGYYVKNFKGKFKGGFMLGGTLDNSGNMLFDNAVSVSKYQIFGDKSVPTSTFCYKADVASSEGANNICLMKIWDEIIRSIYLTPPQETDSRVRQSIDGRPIVIYWKNTDTNVTTFWGKYNFNNDKGTPEVFGMADDGEHNCQSWEFKDNGLALTEFSGDDFDSEITITDSSGNTSVVPAWQAAFEARFPDKFEDTTKLKRVVSWVASTNPETATNKALPSSVIYGNTTYNTDSAEYRLAKFEYEFEDYFIKTPVLAYYIFTDLFLMVDSRAKNQFITTWDGVHWTFLPYDGDTALGIDNIGALNFGYWLEDTSTYNGTDVYNGQKSVLWNNVRKVFAADIRKIAQDMVSAGLNYEYVSNKFNSHQSAWSEGIFCADTQCKYIQPYMNTGSTVYLNMAQGSKASQRDYWLKHRFSYWCSKYLIGSAATTTNRISVRMSTPTSYVVPPTKDINITSFNEGYVSVSFGQAVQTKRCEANGTVTFTSTLDANSDSNIIIYNASDIKSVGDLSGCYIKYLELGNEATNLESVIIGSDAEGYVNEGITGDTFSLGNSHKLKVVNVTNCSNLNGSIDVSKCSNIREVYCQGTKVSAVNLPLGGHLEILKLSEHTSSLMLRNQRDITDLTIDGYDNLTSLYIQDSKVNGSVDFIQDILNKAKNLKNVYLADIDWALDSTDLLDYLLTLGGKSEDGAENTDKSVLTGAVHIPTINTQKLKAYTEQWKDLTITYDVFIPQYKVTFQNDDGTELFVEYVDERSKAYDPIETGEIGTPIKQSTVGEVYTYNGWNLDLANTSIITDMIVIATYVSSVRQYTVKFVQGLNVTTAGQTVLAEYIVDAFADITYDGDTPKEQGSGDLWFLFDKWESNNPDVIIDETTYNVLNGNTVSGVVSDLTLTARFENCQVPVRPLMYLDRDKYEQGITEVVRDDGGNPVAQYDYLYTNDTDNFTSCYTLQQLYAICCSDYYRTEYTLDSSGDTFSHLAVGDKIRIKLDTTKIKDEAIIFTVHGFNHFEKEESTTDNVQMSHVVFGMRDLLNATYQMNSSATNSGGWAKSKMRTWLNSTVFQALPEKLRSIIQPVQVLSTAGNTSIDIVTSIDRLFLFSQREVNLSGTSPFTEEVSPNAESKGFTLYSGNSQRIKKQYNLSGNGSAAYWWLRSPSPSSSANFMYVNSNGGTSNNGTANTSYGVAFGFCVG